MHTPQGAFRCAGLFSLIFALDVLPRVIQQGNSRVAALLRTPVNLAFLANVKVSGSGAAFPVIWFPLDQIFLKQMVIKFVGNSAG